MDLDISYTIGTGNCTNYKSGQTIIQVVQLQDGESMQLNQAVGQRLSELLAKKNMTAYQLHMRSGVPRSTIGNIINCTYPSVKLRIIHEICQGLDVGIEEFFTSALFDENNLEV